MATARPATDEESLAEAVGATEDAARTEGVAGVLTEGDVDGRAEAIAMENRGRLLRTGLRFVRLSLSLFFWLTIVALCLTNHFVLRKSILFSPITIK